MSRFLLNSIDILAPEIALGRSMSAIDVKKESAERKNLIFFCIFLASFDLL